MTVKVTATYDTSSLLKAATRSYRRLLGTGCVRAGKERGPVEGHGLVGAIGNR